MRGGKALIIGLCLLLAGCNLTWREVDLINADTVMIARTRRAQVIAEIERLNLVLRRTAGIENRIVVQSAIDRQQAELSSLNALLYRE